MRNLKVCALAAALAVAAIAAQAITYVVPSDRYLAHAADSIVVGSALNSYTQLRSDGVIETVTTFAVDEVVGGVAVPAQIEVHEPGGAFENHVRIIPGVPQFAAGERVILMLTKTPHGDWAVTDIGLGKFSVVTDRLGHKLALRDEGEITGWDINGELHTEKPRLADGFLDFLRTEKRGGTGREDYFVDRAPVALRPATASTGLHAAAQSFAASTYTPSFSSRWPSMASPIGFYSENTLPNAPGSGITSITTAISRWNGVSGAIISYLYKGADPSPHMNGILGPPDGVNSVIFEVDLSSDGAPAWDCSHGGVLGEGGVTQGVMPGNTLNGESFYSTTEGDVSMNKGINACGAGYSLFTSGDFNTAVTHEIGHTLGFRHSDQTRADNPSVACTTDPTLECSSLAVMKASIPNGINAGLQTWDLHAAQALYPGACSAPTINTQPQNVTITSGNSTTLSVSASGTGLTYQWYVGASGNTAQPVNGATGASVQVSPTVTTSYWVQVASGTCTTNSTAATVTVSGGSCTNPAINSQPQSVSISPGNSTTLSVSASGTTLTYQWYIGAAGNTSQPINGATGTSVLVNPSVTTSYWVQVMSGACATNSATATVTVSQSCIAPSITQQPGSMSITSGQSTSLFVGAGGSAPFTYQWYIGTSGNTSQPINGATSASIIVSPSSTTQYWVQVNNACGPVANSNTATVTVTACVPPSISLDPQDQTITAGSNVSLFVGYTGTTGNVVWYLGTYPDRSQAVGSAQTLNFGPQSNATFWAEVTNGCGSAHSRNVTVTVAVSCVGPQVTSISGTPNPITSGQSVNLTVSATGTSLTYQWYRGAKGDQSNPIAGATSSTFADSPSATTTYWVLVTNGCGSAQSDAVTITVGTQCPTPTITSHSPDETISSNQTATLSVAASGGASFHYQWYQGFSGQTATPVGADAPSFTTPKLFNTTTYWVQVTNDCAASVNSPSITIDVIPAKHRATKH